MPCENGLGAGAEAGRLQIDSAELAADRNTAGAGNMSAVAPFAVRTKAAESGAADRYQWIKFRVFDLTLEHLERQGLDGDTMPVAALQDQIGGAISVGLLDNGAALNQRERVALIDDVMNEIVGLGPLQPFLEDSDVDDIVVNGPGAIYVE